MKTAPLELEEEKQDANRRLSLFPDGLAKRRHQRTVIK